MKIIVAPDSFKGTMTSSEAAEAIRKGVLQAWPEADAVTVPLGDGGEGTVKAIADSLPNTKEITLPTLDPLGREIDASYIIADSHTAYIETAAASGLTLVAQEERDIMKSDTRGTGILIADAFKKGIRKFMICMGGTATCDGGYGCYQKMREHGVKDIDISILCDVKNPLCGPNGAAAVFGPQKGATREEILLLDRRLHECAVFYKKTHGIDVTDIECAGAAGGLAGMLMACYRARALSGISKVLEILDFGSRIKDADMIITGEGGADATTLNGKAAKGILDIASEQGIPVTLMAGRVADREVLISAGFRHVVQATPRFSDPEVSYSDYLTQSTREFLKSLNINKC